MERFCFDAFTGSFTYVRNVCDLAGMINRADVHKIHLFILQYVSPLLFKISEISKLHEIPYEMLQKKL